MKGAQASFQEMLFTGLGNTSVLPLGVPFCRLSRNTPLYLSWPIHPLAQEDK
jgi:hypothetical protein